MTDPFLILGFIPLAAVVGTRAMRFEPTPGAGLRPFERVVLALALGAALLTPVLVAAAAAGLYRPRVLGGVGWLACVVGGILRWRAGTARLGTWSASELLVAGAAVVFAVLAFQGRDEVLGAGRDQQVYASFAAHLSNQGNLAVEYRHLDEIDRTLLREGYTTEACTATLLDRFTRSPLKHTPFVVPGGTNACNGVDHPITLLHPSGWPVWLALAHAALGVDATYGANALVLALGGLIFFVVLRTIASPALAAAGTVLLFAIPAVRWIGGIPLSEPLAMLFTFAAIALVARGGLAVPWLSSAPLFAAMLVRIDTVFVVLAFVAAALAVSIQHPSERGRCVTFTLAQCAALVAALLIHAVLFPGYLETLLTPVLVAVGIALALAGAMSAGLAGLRERLRRVLAQRQVCTVLIALLVLLFLYAGFVRPAFPPFALIQNDGPLAGMRDFREETVRNLAAYLSWPVLALGVAGMALALRRGWLQDDAPSRPLLILVALGPSALYLWAPLISPDQPWALRRFVPTVIPVTVLLAVVPLASLARCMPRRGSMLAVILVGALVAVTQIAGPTGWASFRDNKGMTVQLEAIASALPEALTVADGRLADVSSALLVAYGRSVATQSGSALSPGDGRDVGAWVAAKSAAGAPAWLLHETSLPMTGLRAVRVGDWSIDLAQIRPVHLAPPRDIEQRRLRIALSRIDGLDPEVWDTMFGASPVWGARETGFYGTETAAFGAFRYTNGAATIAVPAAALVRAALLKLDVFHFGGEGIRRATSVAIDGDVIWSGELGAGVSTIIAPLPRHYRADSARLTLMSAPADPGDLGPGDPRKDLSAGLVGVRLLPSGEPSAVPQTMAGFRSSLALDGPLVDSPLAMAERQASIDVLVANIGATRWPVMRELANPVGAVQFAIRWYRPGLGKQHIVDTRWPLWVSLYPGDRTRVRIVLDPVERNGRRLPPGDYEVRIGMVREGIALFADHGDSMLTLPVRVLR